MTNIHFLLADPWLASASSFLLDGAIPGTVSLPFTFKFFTWALFLGGLSAISLPLGSWTGLALKPKPRVTGFMAAFGGGALTAALSVELVAPAALAVVSGGDRHGSHGGTSPQAELMWVCGGMLLGGILFFVLDALVNEKGGFLRRTATAVAYVSKRKAQKSAEILAHLSRVTILRAIPAEGVQRLVDCVRQQAYLAGDVLFREGDKGDRMYFVLSGKVHLSRGGKDLPELGQGDVLGEIALLTGAPRTATAKAIAAVNVLTVRKEDWDHLRKEVPGLEEACAALAAGRLEEIRSKDSAQASAALEWLDNAKSALQSNMDVPTPAELRAAREEHHAAPLAIWLGILLDGIPESFVIGAGFLAILLQAHASGADVESLALTSVIPYTLIAGLFLSNFPEAMSSSVGMKHAGYTSAKILFLWTTLMIMTALGAGLGYWAGESMPHTALAAVEGVAAGAMLTMILSAMMPEAVHLAGAKLAGLAGLFGFLGAIVFKLLE